MRHRHLWVVMDHPDVFLQHDNARLCLECGAAELLDIDGWCSCLMAEDQVKFRDELAALVMTDEERATHELVVAEVGPGTWMPLL